MADNKPLSGKALLVVALSSAIMLGSLPYIVRLGAAMDGLAQTQKNVVIELNSGELLRGDLRRNGDRSYLVINEGGTEIEVHNFKSMVIPNKEQPIKLPLFAILLPTLLIVFHGFLLRFLWQRKI